MSEPLRVLIVEDLEPDAALLIREIKRGGYDVRHERVETPEAFLEALETGDWDIVVSDYSMPRFNVLEALELMRTRGFDLPFILVSGAIGEDMAVECMLAGAHDFIIKGKWQRFIPAIKRELRDAETRRMRKRAEEALRKSEERFKNTIENIFKFVPECILVFSDKLSILRNNKAFKDMVKEYAKGLNYTEKELEEAIIEQVKERIINNDRTEIRIQKNKG